MKQPIGEEFMIVNKFDPNTNIINISIYDFDDDVVYCVRGLLYDYINTTINDNNYD